MIILPTERKTFRARFILGLIYLLLILGAVTMVWPFLMMITGSMSGRYDYHRYSPVLESLWSHEDRFMRILASYHTSFPRHTFENAPEGWSNWTAVSRDEVGIREFTQPWLAGLEDEATREAWRKMAQDAAEFNRSYDVRNSVCAFDERDVAPYVKAIFEEKTGHQGEDVALAALNESWNIRYTSFYGIRFRAQQRVPLKAVDWDWDINDPKTDLWQAFKAHYRETPLLYSRTQPFFIAPLWDQWRKAQNLPPALFPGDENDPDWQRFVRNAYPRRLLRIRVTPELQAQWTQFLEVTCHTTQEYARLTQQPEPKSLADVPLLTYENSVLWRKFIAQLPFQSLEPTAPEIEWQNFLRARYHTLEELNRHYRNAYGQSTTATDWREVPVPFAQAYAITYHDAAGQLLWEDITANYRTVCDFLFLRGDAWWNTLILVLLTIFATLTVNPIAAYALSRFRLRHTEGILLFLLATMAFPAAVTAIPGFLLIRELGLLNTFAALVLPTVANGLSIFILKGFFDALPRELYEAATIDGASEWQIFRHITLPMTTPILAVNALNAFIAAYNSWEWALLVCQKQSHWTLSVWLYQMSRSTAATPWVIMAGFVLVSIPTALVFLLCQRVIMRGIVLPSMK